MSGIDADMLNISGTQIYLACGSTVNAKLPTPRLCEAEALNCVYKEVMEMERRTETEWQLLISEYKKSGKTQEAWSKAKGVNVHTLRGYLYRNTQKSNSKHQNELSTTSWISVTSKAGHSAKEISVIIGSFEIRVTPGFDESTLSQVCRALMQIC